MTVDNRKKLTTAIDTSKNGNLQTIPVDVMLEILKYLDVDSLLTIALVNKSFNAMLSRLLSETKLDSVYYPDVTVSTKNLFFTLKNINNRLGKLETFNPDNDDQYDLLFHLMKQLIDIMVLCDENKKIESPKFFHLTKQCTDHVYLNRRATPIRVSQVVSLTKDVAANKMNIITSSNKTNKEKLQLICNQLFQYMALEDERHYELTYQSAKQVGRAFLRLFKTVEEAQDEKLLRLMREVIAKIAKILKIEKPKFVFGRIDYF